MKVIETGLIPIYEDNSKQVVNARELHEFLEVDTRYNDWIKSRIEKYEFIENQDFTTLTENLVSGGKQNIHIFKLDTAKEIAMVESNEKGKEIRRYFIKIEDKFKSVQDSYVISDPIERAKAWIKEQEEKKLLQTKVQELTPKADYYDDMAERNHLTNFRDTAKELKIRESDFIELLEITGYIYRDGKDRIKPHAQYVPKLFEVKEFVAKNGYSDSQTLITHAGREKFRAFAMEGQLCLSR